MFLMEATTPRSSQSTESTIVRGLGVGNGADLKLHLKRNCINASTGLDAVTFGNASESSLNSIYR